MIFWDLVIEVFHSPPNHINKSKGQESQGNLSRNTTRHMKNNVDHVSSNVRSSRFGPMLFVFEDNEAVIEMINKGRSPTMRHVSRTHRVALDWFFDRIVPDPQIQIRYIDTKHQLADMLTKGNFTRDEWGNLLHLFNSSHFSFHCHAQRIQEQKEDRIVAKSNPMVMNLTSTVSTSSSSVDHPIPSRSPEILKASTDARARRNSKPGSVEFSRKVERCIPWRVDG